MVPVSLILRARRNWILLTGHARVLLAITRDPGMRLRARGGPCTAASGGGWLVRKLQLVVLAAAEVS